MKNETFRLGKSVETVVTRISSGSFSGITLLCTHFANIGPAIMAVGNAISNEYKSTFPKFAL